MSKKKEKRKHSAGREGATEKRAQGRPKPQASLPKKRKPVVASRAGRTPTPDAPEILASPISDAVYIAVESVSVVEVEPEPPFTFPVSGPAERDVWPEVETTANPFAGPTLDVPEERLSRYSAESYVSELVLRNAEEEVNLAMREAEQATRLCGEFDAWETTALGRGSEYLTSQHFEQKPDFVDEGTEDVAYNFEHI